MCQILLYKKKLKLWNIPHATKKKNVLTPRNRLGQYCLSNQVNQTASTAYIKCRVENNSKTNKFPETAPDISDEWEIINLNHGTL